MKVLLIGGTGFIGSYVVRQLIDMGHEVAIFHRGTTQNTDLPPVTDIKGDFEKLDEYLEEFRLFSPEVVVHMVAMNKRVAKKAMDVFEGIAKRIVVPSSMDVYRAYGIVRNEEPTNQVIPTPLTETSPLRTKFYPHGGDTEKIFVEKLVMSNPHLPVTILRLPMVYGPGDPIRIYPYLKRMIDQRPYILIDEERAQWKGSRGYVENVAAAIVTAVINEQSAGKIYNVAEEPARSEQEFLKEMAAVYGWTGEIIHTKREEIPSDWISKLPHHMTANNNYQQHWVMDTSLIRQELNYEEIVSPKEGLRRTINWNINNPPEEKHKDTNPTSTDYEWEDNFVKLRLKKG